MQGSPTSGCRRVYISSLFIFLCIFRKFFQGAMRIQGRDNRTSQLTFQLLPGHFGDLAAFHRYRGVFIEILRVLYLRKFRCGGFGKHIQDQLRISHIIPEVFFLKPLIRLIFFRCLIRPSLCDNIGQKSELYPFPFHNASIRPSGSYGSQCFLIVD